MKMNRKVIFFDTDCLSSFIIVEKFTLLLNYFSNRIVIPQAVFDELVRTNSRIAFYENSLIAFAKYGHLEIKNIEIGDQYFEYFIRFTEIGEPENRRIGDGEAMAISMAIVDNGILASNNLRDTRYFINKYNMEHLTTSKILLSMNRDYTISDDEAYRIWEDMIDKGIWLPKPTFFEYRNFEGDR